MKKIFTIILFAAGTISFASAQSNNQKNIAYNDNKKISNDYGHHSTFDKNNNGAYNNTYFSSRERQAKLEKINREFDQKIAFVKSNRRLNNWEKTRQIQSLQSQRKNEISKVEYQYAKSNQKENDNKYGHDSHKW